MRGALAPLTPEHTSKKEPHLLFNDPSTATGIDWKELHGSLLLITPHEFIPEINTVHGANPAVRADVVILDGSKAGEKFADTLIFPKVLQTQVKGQIGSLVLGRLGQGQKKPGQSAPWTLAAATDADKTIGRDYLAANAEPPF